LVSMYRAYTMNRARVAFFLRDLTGFWNMKCQYFALLLRHQSEEC
jgi:hypothetical protein